MLPDRSRAPHAFASWFGPAYTEDVTVTYKLRLTHKFNIPPNRTQTRTLTGTLRLTAEWRKGKGHRNPPVPG